jgi:hypothetical protein
MLPGCTDIITFGAIKHGDQNKRYVYGIDPASEEDNFSIVILELHANHTRVVHCWTTNKDEFKKRARSGLVKVYDYYGFCARKIRDLMKFFPCEALAIDAQGGGIALLEALGDPDKLLPGESPIYEVIDPDKKKDSDILKGMHVVHMMQFAKYEFTRDANHGLKKDMEDKAILFPRFDPIALANALSDARIQVDHFQKENPGKSLTLMDSLEDCMIEIEELKEELTTIVVTMTGTGTNMRERWDTPEVKMEGNKKGRLRKDRYSSLVMANYIARNIQRAPAEMEYQSFGGFVGEIPTENNKAEDMYEGPDWYNQGMKDVFDR